MTEAERIFLCDQSLKGFSGHCFAYFKPIQEVFSRLGRDCILVGSRDVTPELKARGVEPGFTYWSDERNFSGAARASLEEQADIVRSNHEVAIASDLSALDEKHDFRRDDLIVLNSAKHWPLRGVVRWLESLPFERRPSMLLILHFTGEPIKYRYDPASRHYKDAFEFIEHSSVRDRVHVVADAMTLVDEYRSVSSIQFDLAPIPHTTLPNHLRSREAKIVVSYAGEARINKGFHLLPFVCERMLQSDLADVVEFHVHSFCADPNQRFYRVARSFLSRLSNVHLYDEELDDDRYEAFVREADVLIIAYQQDHYHRQTSGIFAEAMAMGTPVIVSRGTWMAGELQKYGGGEVTMSDDYLELSKRVYQVCRNYEVYASEAAKARDSWNSFHTPEEFVRLARRLTSSK